MSFMDRFKSPESQEKKVSMLEMEKDVRQAELDVEERKALIAELKRKYGRDWMKTLGVKNMVDLSTLRSLAKGSTGLGHFRQGGDLSHLRNTGGNLSHLRRM
jgi:hypothetical protein